MNKYKISISVNGLKKRDRKNKQHFFNFGYVDLNYDENEIMDKARDFIDENMKSTNGQAKILLTYVKIDDVFERFQIYDERNKTLVLKSRLEQALA